MCQPDMKHSGSTTVVERPKHRPAVTNTPAPALGIAGLAAASLPPLTQEPRETNPVAEPAPQKPQAKTPQPPVARPVEPVAPVAPESTKAQKQSKAKQSGKDRQGQKTPPPAVVPQPPVAGPKNVVKAPAAQPAPPSAPEKPPVPPMTRNQALQPDRDRKIRALSSPRRESSLAAEAKQPDSIPENFLGTTRAAIGVVLSQSILSEKNPRFLERNEEPAVLKRLYKLTWNAELRASDLEIQKLPELRQKIVRGLEMHFGADFAKLKLPRFLTGGGA